MAATPSVKVIKNFSFQQSSRNWSNRHHFNGGVPADTGAWDTLFDAIVLVEKTIYSSETEIVECIGYDAGSDVPVASKTYSLAGTMSPPTNCKLAPGINVALARWSTTARSSKNHPIYLFNYFHGAYADYVGSNEQDVLSTLQATAILAYLNAWITGFSDGSHTCVRAGPNGATAVGAEVEAMLGHRLFPR